MAKKPVIIVVSIVAALALGCMFGYAYYYLTYGSNVASANPVSPLEKPDFNPPQTITESEKENSGGEYPPKGEMPGTANEGENTFQPNKPEYENGTEVINDSNEGAPITNGSKEEITDNPVEEPDKQETKVAYITIDDGPDPHTTPAMLKILEEYDIKASFFVLGVFAEKHPKLIEQIYEAGHTIGNHTYNHRYKETYASDKSFWDSVNKTEDIIDEIIGERIKLIREPGGKFLTDQGKQKMIRDQGYGLIHWNIDSYDSRSPIPDAETIFNNVKQQAQKEKLWPAMVILLHDGGAHQSSVEALPKIIKHLQNEGFVFKPLAEMEVEAMAKLPRP